MTCIAKCRKSLVWLMSFLLIVQITTISILAIEPETEDFRSEWETEAKTVENNADMIEEEKTETVDNVELFEENKSIEETEKYEETEVHQETEIHEEFISEKLEETEINNNSLYATEAENISETISENLFSEGEEIDFLSEKYGDIVVTVYRKDHSCFPVDTTLRIWNDPAAMDVQQKEMLNEISTYWSEKSHPEEIRVLEIELLNADGSHFDDGDITIDFQIQDEQIYQKIASNEWNAFAADPMEILKDGEIVEQEEEKRLTFSVTAASDGWFTLVFNSEIADGEELLLVPDEIEEEQFQDMNEEITPDGVGAVNSKPYKVVKAGADTYSGSYSMISAHSNTVITPWSNAGNHVSTVGIPDCDIRGYHPKDGTAGGKFGFRISNVAYNYSQKCAVDMYVTVTKYGDTVNDIMQNPVTDIYNLLGVKQSGRSIWFEYYHEFPQMELKCDLVKSGTTTLVSDNYRMRFVDIDFYQRFGLYYGGHGGSIAQRYCTNDCKVQVMYDTYYGKEYDIIAGNGEESLGDTDSCVLYDIDHTSGFYLLILPEGNKKGTSKSSAFIRQRYEKMESDQLENASGIAWNAAPFGEVLLPEPVKYVGNAKDSLNISNTLAAVDGEYYYMIEQYIPYEPNSPVDAKFTLFEVEDRLPAGADYANEWSAVLLETGGSATGKFTMQNDGDKLLIQMKAENMDNSGVYGYHYRFCFKVRMNSNEISPQIDGDTKVYTIKNKATVRYKTKVSSSVHAMTTNEVTTVASSKRVSPAAPIKGLERNQTLFTRKYDSPDSKITYSVFQQVPRQQKGWEKCTIILKDTLEKCLKYENCQVYLQEEGKSEFHELKDWTIQNSGQSVSATGAYNSSISGGVLRWDITCSAVSESSLVPYQKIVDGRKWSVIPNSANVTFQWNEGNPGTLEKATNQVNALLPVYVADIIVKKINEETGEIIPNAQFAIYEWDGTGYQHSLGTMSYDKEKNEYIMQNVSRTENNKGKFRIVETDTPKGFYGVWEKEIQITDTSIVAVSRQEAGNKMVKGRIRIRKESKRKGEALSGAEYEITANEDIVSPQGKILFAAGTKVDEVKTEEDGSAMSQLLYPGAYKITETKAPLGYALDAQPQIVQVVSLDKNTSETLSETTFVNDRLYAWITIYKEIDSSDLVEAHGNPSFIFEVSGTDVLGQAHEYSDIIEFNAEVQERDNERIVQKLTIPVLAGSYTVRELPAARYHLEAISEVKNGELISSGQEIVFHLEDGGKGSAIFYNKKTTDEDLSHSALVRNVIMQDKSTLTNE